MRDSHFFVENWIEQREHTWRYRAEMFQSKPMVNDYTQAQEDYENTNLASSQWFQQFTGNVASKGSE